MIPIIREETHLLAINKPAGLFTQAPKGISSVQQSIAEQIKSRDSHAGNPFIGLPHRLDRGTSGILLIARNQRALKRFGDQFQSRKVGKFYVAVVKGKCSFGLETWEDWIRKVPNKPLAEIVDQDKEGARHAKLDARVIAAGDSHSVLLFQLHTGRMHQIRVQAAARGWPIIGDVEYGGPTDACFGQESVAESSEHRWYRFALHALRLEFRHPQNAKQLCLTAEIPETWQQLPVDVQVAFSNLVAASTKSEANAWANQLPELSI